MLEFEDAYFKKLICDALRELVPFAQFKKRKKHKWYQIPQRTTFNKNELRLSEEAPHILSAKILSENSLENIGDRIYFLYIFTLKYLALPQDLERKPTISALIFIPKN